MEGGHNKSRSKKKLTRNPGAPQCKKNQHCPKARRPAGKRGR